MEINLNTTTQVDPGSAVFYDRVLLERGKPFQVHARFAMEKSLKQRSGTQIKFRRYGSLPVTTTPLVEGVTPSGKTVTKTDLTVQLKQYGDFIRHSDVVSLVNQDATLTEFHELLGDQSGESLDILARDVYCAGTNVYYAGSYADSSIDTRVEVNTAPTLSDLKKMREIHIGNKARKITKIKTAASGQGTMPIPPSYFAIVSHELQNDLEKVSGWLPVQNYPNQAGVSMEEIGAVPDANVRFLITQNGKKWNAGGGATGAGTTYRSSDSTNVDVYAMLYFGDRAVAHCPLDGESLKSIVKAVGSAGADDPLDQRGSVGWKAFQAWAILNDLWLQRGEFAATL